MVSLRKNNYDKLPPHQKEQMDKYFPIVNKHINKFNPIALTPDAPEDHYDSVSKDIAFHMTGDCNTSDVVDVSQEIYIVIAYWFGKGQVARCDCLTPAKKIVEELSKGKR